MKGRTIAGFTIFVALLAATCMYAIERPIGPPIRVLFIGGGTNDTWQRTAAGANAAAQELGIELTLRNPSADNQLEEQAAIIRTIDYTACDGVALCPTEPNLQLDLLNELAGRTKLVTIGNYENRSKSL